MGRCHIDVLDALGRSMTVLEGEGQQPVQAQGWAPGMYFVRVAPLGDADGVSVWLNVVLRGQ